MLVQKMFYKKVMGLKLGTYAGEGNSGIWLGNLRKRDKLETLGVDGRLVLKQIFNK
jgi:hypothetical protein